MTDATLADVARLVALVLAALDRSARTLDVTTATARRILGEGGAQH